MEDIFAVFLGLIQGGIVFPLALYLGLLVHRDLSQRYTELGAIVNVVAPLTLIIIWIAMSYLAADSLLDIIADSIGARLRVGRLWVLSSFLGLVVLSITFIILDKMKLLKR